jgi:hypothetical protein
MDRTTQGGGAVIGYQREGLFPGVMPLDHGGQIAHHFWPSRAECPNGKDTERGNARRTGSWLPLWTGSRR